MKKLIYVFCTSAQKYPEIPKYIMVRGRKYPVEEVIKTAKIQSLNPPFGMVYYYKLQLENQSVVEIEYHERKSEWYLLNSEKFNNI